MYSIKKIEIDLNQSSNSIKQQPKRPTEPNKMSMTLDLAYQRIAELEKQMTAVLVKLEENKEAKPKKAKKEKSPKKEKADGEPKKKRGMTGYLLFSKENRAAVKEELGEVKPTEVVTEVAKRWKALTDEERTAWNVRAKEGEEGEEVEVEVDDD